MSKYDDEYFFIRKNENNERLPFLMPDINTAERRYADVPLLPGSGPLIFENAYKDEFAARRLKEDIADILFDAAGFIVRNHIRDQLLRLELPNVYLHPAVYIDGQGNWHEDYWYVAVMNQLDCWDRTTSRYDSEQIDFDDELLYSVYTYSLDVEKLDKTPLRDRLLFKMAGTLDAHITCHQSIAKLFRANGNSGAFLQAITDY